MTDKEINAIVRRFYRCDDNVLKCPYYEDCIFGTGKNNAFDCNEDCTADVFANGMYAALDTLEQ